MENLEAHILLSKELNVKYAVLPGDPARIDKILPFFDDYEELQFNREYRSVLGSYQGVKVLALSTGIGGPSMAIAVEELKNIGVEYLIRIGSCGALQSDIKLGELIIAEAAVRDEGTSSSYVDKIYPAAANHDLLEKAITISNELNLPHQVGIIRSHDTFYRDDEDEVSNKWSALGVLGAELETSTLYTVGRLRGLKTLSILNNVVLFGEDTSESIGDYVDGENDSMTGEQNEIKLALETIKAIEVK